MHKENAGRQMLSFVIPCYRSQDSVENVIERIISTVQKDGRYDYEIICVNDCSPDKTLSVLQKIADVNPNVTLIDLMRNFGQHAALMAGFHYVNGDIIVCLDDDGQTPPEEMFCLIDKLDEGYDMVSARYPVKRESLFRRFGSWTASKMGEVMTSKPKDVQLNSYFAIRRIIVDEVVKYPNPYPNVQGLILRATRKITDTDIDHQKRLTGTSGYTLAKLVGLWMNSFTSFSEKPLRLASLLGFLSAFAGFVFGVVVVVRKIMNPEIMLGYSSIMAVMLVMFGIVLLMLGLLGEYIGRMFICINLAPQFVIRSVQNSHNKEDNISHKTELSEIDCPNRNK